MRFTPDSDPWVHNLAEERAVTTMFGYDAWARGLRLIAGREERDTFLENIDKLCASGLASPYSAADALIEVMKHPWPSTRYSPLSQPLGRGETGGCASPGSRDRTTYS